MTTAKRRIALIAPPDDSRRALARYLRDAGFEVLECEELQLATGFAALVVVSPPDISGESLVADVRGWMRSSRNQRVLVITSRPAVLKELAAIHAGRLHVLPAPAFGWDVVDTLRGQTPAGPRGA